MVTLIKNNIEHIHGFCKKYHVASLYLIGSAGRNDKDFTAESDVDFLYKFKKDEIEELAYADNFFELLFALESLLGRKVDLVPEDNLRNPYFIRSINESKQKLYES